MPPKPLTYRVAFSTPWFVIEESVPKNSGESPYYRMTGPDGVVCMPFTPDGDFVMVQQYRPNLDRMTLEMPAGSIDGAETIIEAAAREILEETGHACTDLAELAPGRLHLNRDTHIEHFVMAFDATPVAGAVAEVGIVPTLITRQQFRAMVCEDKIEQTAALSFFGLASAKLGVDLLQDPIALIRQRMNDEAIRRTQNGR